VVRVSPAAVRIRNAGALPKQVTQLHRQHYALGPAFAAQDIQLIIPITQSFSQAWETAVAEPLQTVFHASRQMLEPVASRPSRYGDLQHPADIPKELVPQVG